MNASPGSQPFIENRVQARNGGRRTLLAYYKGSTCDLGLFNKWPGWQDSARHDDTSQLNAKKLYRRSVLLFAG